MSEAETSPGVLSGIRVLDFGRFIAAPWCSAMLADMGADVIRVEKRDGGEDRYVQPVSDTGDGATFLQCNRNKRSLTLDTTTDTGREIQRQLVASADIVIANMPAKAMKTNGLDYESLKAAKPDIILSTATAFGNGGPYSRRVGFDGSGQVMAGGVYRSGLPDMPIRCVVPYVDFGTAQALTIGTMMALFHRQKTGQGQEVEAALLPTAMMMTNGLLIDQAIHKGNKGRAGNTGTAVAPCDLFKMKDGWILVQVASQPMFKRWCRLVGQEEWFEDPRFKDDDTRASNADPLNYMMAEWCTERTVEQAMKDLEEARIPGSPLYSPQQVLDDPHVKEMGYLVPVDYPGMEEPAPVIETPFRLSKTPGQIYSRPPLLGEQTDSVLGSIGYGTDEIVDLRANKIV